MFHVFYILKVIFMQVKYDLLLISHKNEQLYKLADVSAKSI